jgi:voltage-gated potassium channel
VSPGALQWARRVLLALLILTTVVCVGGAVLWWLAGGSLSLADSTFFSLISVSTVGYSEPPELATHHGARIVTSLVIVCGICAMAFFESTITAMLVEGVIGRAMRRRRMQNKLTNISGHYVVAGCGRTGKYCLDEIMGLGKQVVAIDQDEKLLERLNEEQYNGKLTYVVGDATDDHALVAAGVERAKGLIAALADDPANVFLVLSARNLNTQIKIAAKVLQAENEPKMKKAGADRLVSPYRIGGFRLASELVRPRTVEFLDGVLAMSKHDLHMEDVELELGCSLVSKTLRTAWVRAETNALVVAVCEPDGTFVNNPPADHELKAGSHLIVVGDERSMREVRSMAARR